MINIQEKKVFDGVADMKSVYGVMNRDEHLPAMERYDPHRIYGQWFEVNEEVYWYFLEMLPPRNNLGNMFQVPEELAHGLYRTFGYIGTPLPRRYFTFIAHGIEEDMMRVFAEIVTLTRG